MKKKNFEIYLLNNSKLLNILDCNSRSLLFKSDMYEAHDALHSEKNFIDDGKDINLVINIF